MRLTVFNGSPKKVANNTDVLLKHFLAGFAETAGNTSEVIQLNRCDMQKAVETFKQAEAVIFAFPLYVYSVPAGLMQFIDALEPMRGACKGKKIGFIVQYGFSEALHARPLEKYLEKLSASLGCEYLGTIIKGGCDGLTKHPEGFKKLLNQIQRIGNIFGSAGGFDKALLADFARPERQTFLSAIFMRLFVKLANRLYWNPQLKANNALDKAYARPYTR